MTVDADRKPQPRWRRFRGPFCPFVSAVVAAFVVLQLVAMSGVANPRLIGGSHLVTVEGVPHQRMVVHNEAPTGVTVEAARFATSHDGTWLELFENAGPRCDAPELVPYAPRALAEGESVTLYWSMEQPSSRPGSLPGPVEVRARTRAGAVRVITMGHGRSAQPAQLDQLCREPN